ncbi:NTP transferase domain-containing protein [Methylobacterium komagatae]|uniref:NTP transferase domain-containing protein n=1 Tax=Methylobacterium komagatae TaxID=374425 RepID=A0ABW2BJJ6_9HYPH
MIRIGTILLAAGRGTRFGAQPKMLADFGGRPLVRLAAEAALAARPRPVVAVLGAHADAVEAALTGLDLTCVRNEAYSEGLSSSLKAGLAALPVCDAAIVMLGDMPLVGAALIDRLADAFENGGSTAAAVVPVHEGTRGNPVLLNLRVLADGLSALRGDRGAGPLLTGRADIIEIEAEPGITLDVDTPDALAAARNFA